MLHPLHIVILQEVRDHELFEIRDTPRHCTDPVQPDPSGHEFHRLDVISVTHQVFLSTHFTSLYFVKCPATQSFRRFVGVSSNVHHLAHVLTAFNKYFHFTKKSIVSYLTTDTRLRVKPTGRLARIISLLARGFAQNVTPRLHLLEGLLDVSNTCDRRLSRTLPAACV